MSNGGISRLAHIVCEPEQEALVILGMWGYDIRNAAITPRMNDMRSTGLTDKLAKIRPPLLSKKAEHKEDKMGQYEYLVVPFVGQLKRGVLNIENARKVSDQPTRAARMGVLSH